MGELIRNPEIWVLVGFLIFVALLGQTGWKLVTAGLDARAEKIRAQLAEAKALRDEAQAQLDLYKSKQQQAVEAAAEILAAAKEEAERMRREGEDELKRSLATREAQAMDRIAQAEQNALQAVRARVVEIAVRAATGLVAQAIDQEKASTLVDRAIEDLPTHGRA